MKRRELTIPTLVGLFVTVAGLVTGLWLVRNQTGEKAKAEEEARPKEVRISNITDSGFSVSWTTAKAETGFIQYTEAKGGTEMVAADERDQKNAEITAYFTHHVSIKEIKPGTSYKFKIGSGKQLYDQNGQPYQVETAPKLSSTPTADVAYGQINMKDGSPAEGAIVYVQLPGTVLQSALVKEGGSWVIPLSTARVTDLKSYANYDLKAEELKIEVTAGESGKTQLTTDTGSDSPVPTLVIGEIYSKPPPAAVGLSVLTPQQGEKLNSLRPEIIGKAPAGSQVSVEIHSTDPVIGSTVADSNGNYSFSVPVDLTPGEHTLTVTTTINGIARSISNKFTVFAAGESTIPAFSATPSGQLVPSNSPTPTLQPSPVPTVRAATPTPTIRPTSVPVLPTSEPTSVPTLKPLPSPTPVVELHSSGTTGGTILTLALAGLFIATGAYWYRKAS